MKVERTSKGVTIRLDWEECEDMKDELDGAVFISMIAFPTLSAIQSELDEIIGENEE